MRRYWPAALVALMALVFVGWRLSQVDWQARQLAEIGTRFSEQDPAGTEGYDGQFALYMAEDLRPERVADQLDVPAYRYQRILLPLAARSLALGVPALIPWMLIAVNLAAHVAGTATVTGFLVRRGYHARYAVLYGLWAGAFVGIGADLHEPLAYGLAAIGTVQWVDGKRGRGLLALGLAPFAKETTLPFLLAVAAADLMRGLDRRKVTMYAIPLAAYSLWQLWLVVQFGEPGIASGGANATPFEWLPLGGFLRIAGVDLRVFLAFLLLFGPGVIGPAIWGVVRGGRRWLEARSDPLALSLVLNSVIILFLPYSTFREPLGLIRVATGMALAVILFAADRRLRLGYALFWLAYLALMA